ncbi:Uncharacterized protein SCF082_LOCUS31778 [Durusdinium trenchii]|uniref:Uncharacterized protein n=1 Tax=Durusdinium trenchii TaxID=1381693 RepID=A0ABP0N904_9DINO
MAQCLKVRGCSEKALRGILKIASKDAVPKSYTGYKRKVRDELPSDCVLKVPVGPDETGKMVHIAVTHLPKYFQYMAVRSVPFVRRLLSVVDRSMGSLLQPLLYWDEVVSGNPLAPHSAKKVAVGYVTLSELQQRQKEEVWFPLFIAQHTSLESVAGGFSKTMREVVLLLQSFHMEHGIALELDGYHRWLRVNLMQGYFIADFDAIRATFAWRGSASIKACFACKNVCKKGSNLRDEEGYITEISETEWAKLDLWSDQEVFDLWDLMARETGNMNKKQQERLEKISGYNFHAGAVLANPIAKQILKPTQVVQFMAVLSTKSDFKCEDLQVAPPLMLYHIIDAVPDTVAVTPELQSFYALNKLLATLKSLQRGITKDKCELLLRQTEQYLKLYRDAYNDFKPKHHYQLHLSQMIWRSQLLVDCFPQEAKHRTYKYQIQNRVDGLLQDAFLFDAGVLSRLLNYHCTLLEKPFLPGDLTPPISESHQHVDGTLELVEEGKALDLQNGRVYKQDFVLSSVANGLVVDQWASCDVTVWRDEGFHKLVAADEFEKDWQKPSHWHIRADGGILCLW